MSPPQPPTCAHSVPSSLSPQPHKCPLCIVAHHIADLKDVQKVLRTRGGVFFSRGRPKSDKHRALMDRWRKAKVQLLNVVCILEASMSEQATEEWKDVKDVLDLWEQEKEDLAKVPGYVYEGEKVQLSEDVVSIVNGMLDGLRNSMVGLLLQGEDGPEVVVAKPSITSPAGSTSATSTLSTSIPLNAPAQDSCSESTIIAAIRPRSRSILKRKYINHDAPPSSKRVRTTDFATVSSEYLTISNPSPFIKLSTTEMMQPHSRSTSAELKRRKSCFSRSSESYLPGAWASPAFSMKPNTSFFKLEWNEVEDLWREEEEEVAEEKRVHERLRIIAEVYVMSWWVRSVASNVGLEKVVKIGQAVSENTEATDGSDGVA